MGFPHAARALLVGAKTGSRGYGTSYPSLPAGVRGRPNQGSNAGARRRGTPCPPPALPPPWIEIMFTVRPHPPKGPSSAPFSSPGGAVVAFGGRFPALLLLLGLVFVFLPVYFCVRFSWVFALPAYRPWSFIFLPSLGSAFSGGRLRRLILLAPSPVLFPVVSASRGSFFFGPVFLPGLPCLGPVSLCVRLGASFCSWSFSVFPLCFPGRLSSL